MVSLFYTTYINVDLAHHEIFRAKVGKGGMNSCEGLICVFIFLPYGACLSVGSTERFVLASASRTGAKSTNTL